MTDAPCRLLPWDSEFFGVTIAAVNGDALTEARWRAIEAWCAAERVDCLYFLARSDDNETVRLAEAAAFHLVDVRLTFEARPTRADAPPSIRRFTPSDLPALQRIARVSHTDTRFYYDGRFPRSKCDELYERWILTESQNDTVFVADVDGQPVGYTTCRLGQTSGHGPSIGLVAVDAPHQGKRLGQSLVRAALNWLAEQNANRVTVVTQGRNLPAQRLYALCGFIPRDVQLYYHRWFTR